jgi:hypothetical protein
MATFNYLPIAIAYHGALSILIGASMRSAFSALRPAHIELFHAALSSLC